MLKKGEITCLDCDGAGLVSGCTFSKPTLCPVCNGHGVVAWDKYNEKVVRFDVEATTRTRLAMVNGQADYER